MINVAEIIKASRAQAGLTQRELSKISGVSEPCICNYERNKSVPKVYDFEAILEACGLTLSIGKKVCND